MRGTHAAAAARDEPFPARPASPTGRPRLGRSVVGHPHTPTSREEPRPEAPRDGTGVLPADPAAGVASQGPAVRIAPATLPRLPVLAREAGRAGKCSRNPDGRELSVSP